MTMLRYSLNSINSNNRLLMSLAPLFTLVTSYSTRALAFLVFVDLLERASQSFLVLDVHLSWGMNHLLQSRSWGSFLLN